MQEKASLVGSKEWRGRGLLSIPGKFLQGWDFFKQYKQQLLPEVFWSEIFLNCPLSEFFLTEVRTFFIFRQYEILLFFGCFHLLLLALNIQTILPLCSITGPRHPFWSVCFDDII